MGRLARRAARAARVRFIGIAAEGAARDRLIAAGAEEVYASPAALTIHQNLAAAQSAREVSYLDPSRIRFVAVRTAGIWQDFDSPESYRRLRRVVARG